MRNRDLISTWIRVIPTITTRDGTELFYKDWGSGRPVVLSHGWPLNADAWDEQLLFLAQNGYRAIAHDRRGYGRSSQPSGGNDMDTYANLRRLRVGKGLTQERLALAAGLDRAYVGRVERGSENVTVTTLEALARVLGEPVAALFREPARGERRPEPLKAGRKPRVE